MTPKQRTETLRLADAMQAGSDDPMWVHHAEVKKSTLGYAAALLRELAAEPQGEPMAWLDSAGQPHHIRAVQTAANRRLYGRWRPLYTHPQQQQQRKPLTDGELTALMSRQVADITPDEALMCRGVARAVERAHDIKEAP